MVPGVNTSPRIEGKGRGIIAPKYFHKNIVESVATAMVEPNLVI